MTQEQPVTEQPQEYRWSKYLCSEDIEIEADVVTIKHKGGCYDKLLVNKPMSADKHVWKIKIENMGLNHDLVGVSDIINEFNRNLRYK